MEYIKEAKHVNELHSQCSLKWDNKSFKKYINNNRFNGSKKGSCKAVFMPF